MRPAWLYLEESTSKLLAGTPKEDRIHKTRITLRQLRTTLSNFKLHFDPLFYQEAKNSLRGLTSDLAILRELDVFAIEINRLSSIGSTNVPPENFLLLQKMAETNRVQYTAQLQSDVSAFRNSSGYQAMQTFINSYETNNILGVFSPKKIQQSIAEIVQKHITQIYLLTPSATAIVPSDTFHPLRIELKELRYTLDAFQPFLHANASEWITPLKSLQDSMGDIHDRQIWIETMPRLLNESSRTEIHDTSNSTISCTLQNLSVYWQEDISHRYRTFLMLWTNLEQQKYWEQLMHQMKRIPMA